MAVAPTPTPDRGIAPGLRDLLETVLAGYSQILLSRSGWVGFLLLLSTAVVPRLFLWGLFAVILALGLVQLLHLSGELSRSGLFGYNALLIGVGGAALLPPGGISAGLIVVAIMASVVVTAALHSALWSTFNLPVLTLPFLLVFYLLLGAASGLGLHLNALPVDTLGLELPYWVALYFQSLGAIFFSPQVATGLLVFLGLIVFSRIAVTLSFLGYAVAYLLGVQLELLPGGGLLPLMAGYNFILTAIAVGGVWFVPGGASFLLALGSVLVCGLVTVGAEPLLARGGVPLLILPFNLTVILVLYAMRQRIRDDRPKAVDFLLGTPEQNLNFFQTRVARFGAHSAVRLQAPFLGRWVCTQGVEGEHTHRGAWRHALDFEVEGPDGRTHSGRGEQASDYHCFRKPVIAPAAGTVVQIIDGVPDNAIGEMNLRDNWGNAVLLHHAPGVYSLVAHLAAGSIEVQEGQRVRPGDGLGRCGNSGRSAVPHLHFQLQAIGRIGAPTRELELHDLVDENGEGKVWRATWTPVQGETVRNLEVREEVEALFQFPIGESLLFEEEREGARDRREQIEPGIELLGSVFLRSRETSAVTYYQLGDASFVAYDTVGSRRSVLHFLQAAIGRVPFEFGADLRWSDELPLRQFLARPVAWLMDVVAPFLWRFSLTVDYRAEPTEGGLLIHGESRRRTRGGAAWLKTRALFQTGKGPTEFEVTVAGHTRRAKRIEPEVIEKEHRGHDPANRRRRSP